MSLNTAIVGLPNVGKSTLFNALLKRQAALAANYPFATIEPNVGIAEVPDERLPILAGIVKTTVIKPAVIRFIDIAGLVKGAHKGEGLGNQFLAKIREADVICHVLRAFNDPDVVVVGRLDPSEDLKTIRAELALKDLESLTVQSEKCKTQSDKAKLKVYEKISKTLNQGKMVDRTDLSKEEREIVDELFLLTAKPEIFVINISEKQLTGGLAKDFHKKIHVPESEVIYICAKTEAELAVLSQEDQELYLNDLGLEKSGVEQMAQAAYQKLNLISFLTAGEKEVKAWTIARGSTARQAAGVIHSDFYDKFIKAKVCEYKDFILYGGFKTAAEKGRVRLEGKDYIMKEDDVVEFMIGK